MIPENFNLGYACICTELRKKGVYSSRTCRLKTIQKKGIEYAKELAILNLKDLKKILEWNVQHNIFFMRISSDIFPFASHPIYGYKIDFAKEYLEDIGNYAKTNNIRLTFHPSQFNVLSSPNKSVIKNTFLDLQHHSDILDTMMLDKNSVLIIHGGGVYNNKKESLIRLETNIMLLSKRIRKRLVLENCEMSYNIEDLLPLSKKLLIPLCIDFHHDDIYKSNELVSYYYEEIFDVWKKRNIKPKVHVSNSIPDILQDANIRDRRKHSDYIAFFHDELLKIKFPIDVMLECKMKEQSIFQLRKL